jgi:hypothetical protein
MTQHSTLSPERWSAFSLDQQILMIANEMNRAGKLTRPEDDGRRRSAYERVLNLTDLTIRVQTKRTLRRELLRWRDLVAEIFVAEASDEAAHASAFRALLGFPPEAWRQISTLA